MFPIKDYTKYKIGYRHGDKTFYSSFHFGIDIWTPENTIVYAPFNGVVEKTFGPDGGLTILFKANKKVYRLLHLNKILKLGNVKEGEPIALTGGKPGNPNAGKSTAAHIHIDISKDSLQLNNRANFIDPEKEIWNMVEIKLAIVDNQRWNDLAPQLEQIKKLASDWSGGNLQVSFINTVQTDFQNIPLEDYSSSAMGTFPGPTRAWMKENIFQFRKDADTILFNVRERPETNHQGYCLSPDEAGGPFILLCEITNGDLFFRDNGYTDFTKLALHELAHNLRMVTGQETLPDELRDDSRQIYSWTHYYDYHPDHKLSEAYSTLDYARLLANLTLRRQQRTTEPMDKIVVFKKRGTSLIARLGDENWDGYATLAAFQKHTQGKTIVELELDAAQFDKLPLSQAVFKE